MNGVDFSRSQKSISEWGLDVNKERWEIVTNEVVIQAVSRLAEVLNSWAIPQLAP
jgi:hypothetical protein